MKRILRMIAGFTLLSGMLLVPAGTAIAQLDIVNDDVCSRANGVGGNPTACQDDNPGQDRLFGDRGIFTIVVNVISIVIGVAAVVVIIIAGIQYMTSTGDATKTNNAKNALIYAIVGVVVALLAQAVVRLAGSNLG